MFSNFWAYRQKNNPARPAGPAVSVNVFICLRSASRKLPHTMLHNVGWLALFYGMGAFTRYIPYQRIIRKFDRMRRGYKTLFTQAATE